MEGNYMGISTLINHLGTIGTIAQGVTIVAFILMIPYRIPMRRYMKHSAANLMFRKNLDLDKYKEKGKAFKYYNSYVVNSRGLQRYEKPNEYYNVKINDFIKKLKKNEWENKITLVLGEQGFGKSELMKYIAYEFARGKDFIPKPKELVKERKKNDSLKDRGICYLTLVEYNSLEIILDRIKSKSKASNLFILDGFDEYHQINEIEYKNINLMNELLEKLSTTDFSEHYGQIIITSRISIFEGEEASIDDIHLPIKERDTNTFIKPSILKILPYSEKQLTKIVLNRLAFYGNKQHKIDFKAFYSDDSNKKLLTPFYADAIAAHPEILKLYNGKDGNFIKQLIRLKLIDEYRTYEKNMKDIDVVHEKVKIIPEEEFLSDAEKVMTNIATLMLQMNRAWISRAELTAILGKKYKYMENQLEYRLLIKYTPDKNIVFSHSFYYMYFILLSVARTKNFDKVPYIYEYAIKNIGLENYKMFYFNYLEDNFKQEVATILDNVDTIRKTDKKEIAKTRDNLYEADIVDVNCEFQTIDQLILFFPGIKLIRYKQYLMNAQSIRDYLSEGIIDFNGQNIHTMNHLDKFIDLRKVKELNVISYHLEKVILYKELKLDCLYFYVSDINQLNRVIESNVSKWLCVQFKTTDVELTIDIYEAYLNHNIDTDIAPSFEDVYKICQKLPMRKTIKYLSALYYMYLACDEHNNEELLFIGYYLAYNLCETEQYEEGIKIYREVYV